MARTKYAGNSPYASTPQSSWYIGRYVHRDVPVSANDQSVLITPRYQFRPDLLSNDLYGTPAYWWVFILRNRDLMKDPVWDLKSGMTIKVPSAAALKKAFGS